MVRARAFARRHAIELPARESGERGHEYFRKVRRWIKERSENHPSQGDASLKWPELKRAAGTHLVLSPDPKIWQAIRATGLDERLFLKTVATQTMKDFSDWRRNLVGTGHVLGWVAGTHVRDNGADRHPHIHLVVMKRDDAEQGNARLWSLPDLNPTRRSFWNFCAVRVCASILLDPGVATSSLSREIDSRIHPNASAKAQVCIPGHGWVGSKVKKSSACPQRSQTISRTTQRCSKTF